VLDGTKFVSVAATLPEGKDAWQAIMIDKEFPSTKIDVAAVMTLPATGSEWNNTFVISRRSIDGKLPSSWENTYPVFSMIDPTYTMTLPLRQVANGVFDGIAHVIDQFMTGEENPLMDRCWMATMKEFVTIGPDVVKPDSSIELRGRLSLACSFALNLLFTLGKATCWGIHMIGHQVTARWGIDHGASLSIVAPDFLESQLQVRKVLLAKSAEFVFDVETGTVEEKAQAFITKLREFIRVIGMPEKVGDVPGVEIEPGDVDKVTKMVMESVGNAPYGWKGLITEDITRSILTKVVVPGEARAHTENASSKCCELL
jgi:alcohol dehydrogenase YqhD (iron-dependent ADH family)